MILFLLKLGLPPSGLGVSFVFLVRIHASTNVYIVCSCRKMSVRVQSQELVHSTKECKHVERSSSIRSGDDQQRGRERDQRRRFSSIWGVEDLYISLHFLKKYASGTWCLDKLGKILQCKEFSKKWKVRQIFYKVNRGSTKIKRKFCYF